MTKIHNDPAEFTEDALTGFCLLHRRHVRGVTGGVVRSTPGECCKVAILVGGGSGHYPAFMGWVGPGFADGAVVGNVFSAPSAQFAYSVARSADRGGGVIFAYGNHAGDVMNFGIATEQLTHEGIDTRNVIVTDDILAAPPEEAAKRRGIAGDFTVFKILGAAAETGATIDEVERLGRLANDRTRTIGIGLAGCTMPGATEPLFTVEPGTMGIGLGLHGEPGLETVELGDARTMAARLVEPLLAETPGDSTRLAVILNGLGATKYEELFVLWTEVATLFAEAGCELVHPEVGELVTSLDMAGISLTVTWLDDELEPLWCAPADTPAFRRGTVDGMSQTEGDAVADEEATRAPDQLPKATKQSRGQAALVVAMIEAASAAVRQAQSELGRLDAVAGDGDHGRGMVRGIAAAHEAAVDAVAAGGGAGTTLARAGDAWAAQAGGTSGVLWGSAVRTAGIRLGDEGADAEDVADATQAFVDTIMRLGKAQEGDKTLLDAALPYVQTLRAELGAGLAKAARAAAEEADRAAQATADLEPKVGRARPNAKRSVGTPDPGAVSFAMIAKAAVGVADRA